MSSGCIKPELNLTSPGQGCWGIATSGAVYIGRLSIWTDNDSGGSRTLLAVVGTCAMGVGLHYMVSQNEEHYNGLKALRLTAFCWTTWQCFTDLLDLIGYMDGIVYEGFCLFLFTAGCYGWLDPVILFQRFLLKHCDAIDFCSPCC
jgi:hypothetical protein